MKNKKMKKQILTTGLLIGTSLLMSSSFIYQNLQPTPNVTLTNQTRTLSRASVIQLKPELSNNPYHKPIYSLNNMEDISFRDKVPESILVADWKNFLINRKTQLFQTANNAPVSIDDINIQITKASNELEEVLLTLTEISSGQKIGDLTIRDFKARPALPKYIKSSDIYQVIDGSDVGLKNIANLLTNQGFVDAQAINRNWYPFQYVDAMINNQSDVYNQIKEIALSNFLFSPNNKLTPTTEIELTLPNFNSHTVDEYHKTGIYETLNNAIDGQKETPQLAFNLTFKNVIVNGKEIFQKVYPIHLYNAQVIAAPCFNTNSELRTNITQLPVNNFGNTLDELNISELLVSLGYYANASKKADLPVSYVSLHQGTTPTKDYNTNSITLRVDISNIIHDDNAKYIGHLSDLTWIVEGFNSANGGTTPNANVSTTFNAGSVLSINAPGQISSSLAEDIEPDQLLGLIPVDHLITMFHSLPADFKSKNIPNYYVVNSIEKGYMNKNEIKVNIALTYAKISNQDIYNEKGTAVRGYFIIKGFTTPKKFANLSDRIVAKTQEEIYQFNPVDAIREHLIEYIKKTNNTFSKKIKDKLLVFLNDYQQFSSSLNIISSIANVKANFKDAPELEIKVTNNKLTEISEDPTFNQINGYTFKITNFLPYHPTTITVVKNSFTNYDYNQFVDEVAKGNVGVNKQDKNNLAQIENLPNNKIPPTLTVSKIHTTGINSKAIVSINFAQFYGENGLVEDYTYNIVVALKQEIPPLVDTPIFNERVSVADIDNAGASQWRNKTAPLMVEYLNDINHKQEIKALLNKNNVAQLLFYQAVPTNYNIDFSIAALKVKTPNTITLTITNNQGIKQTIDIYGFAPINGATVVSSVLPRGTNFDTLKNEFDSIVGNQLDQKAKTFLNVLNPVEGYQVQKVVVLSVAPNHDGQKVARITFKLSKIYVDHGANTYKIVSNVLYQFEYIENTYATVVGKLIDTTYENTSVYAPTNWTLIWSLTLSLITTLIITLIVTSILKRKKP